MAVTIKNLGAGTVTYTSPAYKDIYAPASSKAGIVQNLVLTNTHTSAVSVDIVVNKSSADYKVVPTLTIAPSATIVLENEISLANGESLRGQNVGVQSVIQFIASGIERDV
jgi:hypothetical protein